MKVCLAFSWYTWLAGLQECFLTFSLLPAETWRFVTFLMGRKAC